MVRTSLGIAFVLVLAACSGTVEEADTAVNQSPSQTEATTQADAATQADPTTTVAPPVDVPSGDSASGGPITVPAGDSTVSVGGQPLITQQIVRCIPFNDGDENLDLAMLGDGFTFFVYIDVSNAGRNEELGINGLAVGDGESVGLFGAIVSDFTGSWTNDSLGPVDGPAFDWQGDRISGTMTLVDFNEIADPIEVSFDMIVPSDISDCSL